jgi:ABC-type phosphate transport system substrate-binding protein
MLHKPHNSVITLAVLLSLVGLSEPARAFLVAQSDSTSKTFAVPDTLSKDTKIQIAASNSTSSLNQSLKESFIAKYPNAQVNITTQASGNDLKALSEGKADLVAIGRPLTAAEKAQGYKAVPISREKIAIIVSKNNPYNGNLTISQFAQIFKGEISDWSEIGGSPGSIKVVDLPSTNDTRQAFPNYPVFQTGEFKTGANAIQLKQDSTEKMIAQLGNNGIGYAVANDVMNRDDVKVISMHQTQPDDQRYPFSQPFSLIYKGTPNEAAQAFLGFATTQGGQQVLSNLAGSLSNTDAMAIASSFSNKLSGATSTPQADTSNTGADGKTNANGNGTIAGADGKTNANGNGTIAGADGNTNANGNGTIAGADGKTNANGNGTIAGADGKTNANGNGTIAGADGKTNANGNGTIAGADGNTNANSNGITGGVTGLENSGEVNPNAEGSGKVNPNLNDSGKVNPNVEGSGQVNPNLNGSGEVNPNLNDSGEVNPNVEGSGEPNSAAKLDANGAANSDATAQGEKNSAASSTNNNNQNAATTAKKGSWWWWLPLLLLLPLGALAVYLFGRGRKSDQEPAISNIPNPDDPQGGTGVPIAPNPPDNLAASGANAANNMANVASNTAGNSSRVGGAAIAAGGAAIAGGATAAHLVGDKNRTKADTDIDLNLDLDQPETEINEIPSNPVDEFTSQSTKLQGTEQSTKLQTDTNFDDGVDNPIDEFTSQSTKLQGTEQSTKLQTDTDLSIDDNVDVENSDPGLLGNVAPIAGAAIAGGATANWFNERQSTTTDPDLNLELDQPETEIDNSVVETSVSPVDEFTSQSTKLQGTEQSTELQTDTDLSIDDNVDVENSDPGLLDNVASVGGAAIAGGATANWFNERQSTTTDPDLNLELDQPETEIDNSVVETSASPVDEFTSQSTKLQGTEQSTKLQTDTNFKINDDVDVENSGVESSSNPTSIEEAGKGISSLFTQDNQPTTEKITEVNPNLEATNVVNSVNTPQINLSESENTTTETTSNWIDRATQNKDAAITAGAAAIAGGAAAVSGLFNQNNQPTTEEITEVNPNLEATDTVDSVDTPEMDLSLDDFETETPTNPANEFTSQSTKLQGTEQSTKLQTDLINDDFDLELSDNTTTENKSREFNWVTEEENQSTIEPQIVEGDLENLELGTTDSNFAANVIADAETTVVDEQNSNVQEITFDEITDTNSENVSLNDITFDENNNSINASLQEITFDEITDTNSENVSLDDITFDENNDSINASLQEITFDEITDTNSENVSLDGITFDGNNDISNENLEEITFDENESKTINDLINSLETNGSNQEFNLDSFSSEQSTENSTNNLLSNNTAEIVDFETENSNDMNSISSWLEGLETSNQNTEDISEWLDKLNVSDQNSLGENSNNDVKIIETQEENEEISFQFLEDLLERDINGNKENK